jgi:uncharacterized repeat protein (TIGR03803 family)
MKAQRLTSSGSGFLVTAALVLFLTGAALAAPKYKILHNFTGNADGDGGNALALDRRGNIYGASLGGGSQNCGPGGCGLIYELTQHAHGKYTFAVLYGFTGGSDAGSPNSPLLLDASGDLYGTTASGGARGGGTVFELTPGAGGWTQTVLYSFCNQLGCVGLPQAGLVMDQAGNLYGTTPEEPHGGAVYRLADFSGRWKEAVLHKFCPNGGGDGYDPFAGLILDAAGNLYGTTQVGGTGCPGEGCGIVYELTPEPGGKWEEAILHRFDNNGKDGYTPGAGALFMDALGSLYGTTGTGGGAGYGALFKLSKNASGRWEETVLHNFSNSSGGSFPDAGVVMDKSGNLYGTTDGGGGPGCGVIYKLAPAAKGKWKYSVLHTFGNAYDGCLPVGNLAIDSSGNLYGGTIFGGTGGYGVIFELTP